MKTFDLNFMGETYKNCWFIIGEYVYGETYIGIENEEDGAICDVSVNIGDSFFLPKTDFYTKDYDMIPEIVADLKKKGFIKNSQFFKATQGFGTFTPYKMSKKMEAYILEGKDIYNKIMKGDD